MWVFDGSGPIRPLLSVFSHGSITSLSTVVPFHPMSRTRSLSIDDLQNRRSGDHCAVFMGSHDLVMAVVPLEVRWVTGPKPDAGKVDLTL